ncbi:hypothetical protein C3B55_00838 [Candidatus Pseudomonas adelgestsugas]|uniref:Uncharacterized protein n=1 Tax=Candidatus Pseudomonas adelgestsugas TaxID=1302376 RepID=A0ABX5R9B1_9PSED|nr:hypothetical protein C3B55_00838 [Candidatus Pseudomonas adelgestsugas]
MYNTRVGNMQYTSIKNDMYRFAMSINLLVCLFRDIICLEVYIF